MAESGLRERKNARTRAAIERAALELAIEQGFERTTVDQIAERADVSPRTVFGRYTTKDAIVFGDIAAEQRAFEAWLEEAQGDLLERVAASIRGLMEGGESDELAHLRLRAMLVDPYLRGSSGAASMPSSTRSPSAWAGELAGDPTTCACAPSAPASPGCSSPSPIVPSSIPRAPTRSATSRTAWRSYAPRWTGFAPHSKENDPCGFSSPAPAPASAPRWPVSSPTSGTIWCSPRGGSSAWSICATRSWAATPDAGSTSRGWTSPTTTPSSACSPSTRRSTA